VCFYHCFHHCFLTGGSKRQREVAALVHLSDCHTSGAHTTLGDHRRRNASFGPVTSAISRELRRIAHRTHNAEDDGIGVLPRKLKRDPGNPVFGTR